MKEFKQEDYAMPENYEISSDKKTTQEESFVAEDNLEQMEAEIQQAQVFFENVDGISHKNYFTGEKAYIEKIKELEQEKNNLDSNKSIDDKIYYQKIVNLLDSHNKALDAIANKEKQHKPGELPTSEQLFDKSDEISERKAVIERHLFDLGNYIK